TKFCLHNAPRRLIACLSVSDAAAVLLLALGQFLLRSRVIAKPLQPNPVLARQPASDMDCIRRLLEFLLHLIQINQRAADFFPQGCIVLEEVRTFRPHPFEQRAQDIEVAPKPLACGTQNPNPIFLRPAALAVSLPKLGLIPRDNDTDWSVALPCIPNQLPDIAFGDRRLVFVVDQELWLKGRTTGATECQ